MPGVGLVRWPLTFEVREHLLEPIRPQRWPCARVIELRRDRQHEWRAVLAEELGASSLRPRQALGSCIWG